MYGNRGYGVGAEQSNSNVEIPPSESSSSFSLSPEPLPDPTDNDAYLRAGDMTPHSASMEVVSPRVMADISIWCKKCCFHVSIRELNWHKQYHRALDVLEFTSDYPPLSVDELIQRRNEMVRNLANQQKRKDQPVPPMDMKRIDDAYEILKSDLEDTYEEYRRMLEEPCLDVHSSSLNCSPGCVYAVGICSEANDRWKNAMEDTRVFQDYYGNDSEKCFFGIYDGHHGRFAADVAANHLHHGLLMDMALFDPKTTCTCTVNMADSYDISEYEILSKPPSRSSTPGVLHETSSNIIQQVIRMCQDNLEVITNAGPVKDADGNDGDENKPTKSQREKKVYKNPFDEKMAKAFSKAHRYVDNILSYGKDERSRVRWSGVSTLTCVIQGKKTLEKDLPQKEVSEEDGTGEKRVFGDAVENVEVPGDVKKDKSDEVTIPVKEETGERKTPEKVDPPMELGTIHIANAGNVEALLVRANRAYKITKKHTPHNPREKQRVLKTGVSVSDSERDMVVNGVLLTTRGLGNHGDPKLKKCVLVEPYSNSIPLDQYAQFIVLASRGVWSVLDEDDVMHLMLQMLPEQQVPGPSRVSSSVADLLRHLEAVSEVGLVPGPLFKSTTSSYRSPSSSSMATAIGSQHQFKQHPLKSSMKKDRPLTGQSSKSKVTIVDSNTQIQSHYSIQEDAENNKNATELNTGSDANSDKASDKAKSKNQESGSNKSVKSESGSNKSGSNKSVKSESSSKKSIKSESQSNKNLKSDSGNMKPEEKSSSTLKSESQILETLTSAQDLQKEMESETKESSYAESVNVHDSGNEADVDTEVRSKVPIESPVPQRKEMTREELHREYAERMAERLTQAALLAGGRDNITVMVILLPGSGL